MREISYYWGKEAKTHFVRCITVLHHTICPDDDAIDIVMLEERAEHSIACSLLATTQNALEKYRTDHARRYFKGCELQ